jgi:SAM-dependent methyltransferase
MDAVSGESLPGPQDGDPFGDVLRRCWKAKGRPGISFEVTERDDGFIYVLDAARYLRPPDRLSQIDDWACARAAGRVLDVGCGAGRHAIALMRRGLTVVGLDPSPGAVEVATASGVTAVRGSAEDAPASLGRFDTVLLMGHNLGLLESRDKAAPFLEKLAGLVNPGGCLIGSGIDPYVSRTPEDLGYQARNRARGRMPGQLRIRIRDRRRSSPWFDYLALSPAELESLAAGTPWTLEESATAPDYLMSGDYVVLFRR